jgi:bisphosphoglycerate-independent phosphoglycerate mutase (AlkP superfamily)
VNDGKLADVAPTVLALLGIEKPQTMSGVSLI